MKVKETIKDETIRLRTNKLIRDQISQLCVKYNTDKSKLIRQLITQAYMLDFSR